MLERFGPLQKAITRPIPLKADLGGVLHERYDSALPSFLDMTWQ